ncbi:MULTISPECIES: helix-turn-helix domain-containing protein [unclassified Butyrivibrio]|uniref:helix-turn-helix domain-containing protein n=1 Tax=unclassified Butyrivibrio TaxID=2639466 RepID=UPI000408B172|nr:MULTISPECIES: helix-turn-helix domain-containing protein [unclassified Butyrivibrio]
MKDNTFITPNFIKSDDIKALRAKLKMTQKEFAFFCNVSKPTVERWEMSDKEITGPITLLAQIVLRHPDIADELSLPEKKFPMRLWYYYMNTVCTIIDVDTINQRVRIKNYTDNLVFRAFGRNDNPTFADYEEFLRSRCFPEERDKMKLMLRELDIPFYDPLMIIEKTDGRMAEDDFWIRIDR